MLDPRGNRRSLVRGQESETNASCRMKRAAV